MTTGDKQYTAAKALTMLKASLSSPKKKDVPALIEKADKAQLQELIGEIQLSMEEHDALKKCKFRND